MVDLLRRGREEDNWERQHQVISPHIELGIQKTFPRERLEGRKMKFEIIVESQDTNRSLADTESECLW